MTRICFLFYRRRNWSKEREEIGPRPIAESGRMLLHGAALIVEPWLFTVIYSFGDGPRVPGKAQDLLKWWLSSWMAEDSIACACFLRTCCRMNENWVLLLKGKEYKCTFISPVQREKALRSGTGIQRLRLQITTSLFPTAYKEIFSAPN